MLQKNWNTWNVRSVLSHVCLPDGFAISLGIKTYSTGLCLREALIGRKGEKEEKIIPGEHAYDGSFTSLEMEWSDAEIRVETAVDGGDWFAEVTLLSSNIKTPSLTIEGAVLWNRPGNVKREDGKLVFSNSEKTLTVTTSGKQRNY